DALERGQLREHERVVALPEAMQVEHEPTEIAVGELTGPAQVARAPACPSTLDEGRTRVRAAGACAGWLAFLLRACAGGAGACARCVLHDATMLLSAPPVPSRARSATRRARAPPSSARRTPRRAHAR